jgi:hypothetical protein
MRGVDKDAKGIDPPETAEKKPILIVFGRNLIKKYVVSPHGFPASRT